MDSISNYKKNPVLFVTMLTNTISIPNGLILPERKRVRAQTVKGKGDRIKTAVADDKSPRRHGAGDGNRTRTLSRTRDFKSRASASSATPALNRSTVSSARKTVKIEDETDRQYEISIINESI